MKIPSRLLDSIKESFEENLKDSLENNYHNQGSCLENAIYDCLIDDDKAMLEWFKENEDKYIKDWFETDSMWINYSEDDERLFNELLDDELSIVRYIEEDYYYVLSEYIEDKIENSSEFKRVGNKLMYYKQPSGYLTYGDVDEPTWVCEFDADDSSEYEDILYEYVSDWVIGNCGGGRCKNFFSFICDEWEKEVTSISKSKIKLVERNLKLNNVQNKLIS